MAKLDVLRLVHILAGMVWVGGRIIFVALGARLANAARDRQLAFNETMGFVGGRIFGPAAFLVLGAGIWLVVEDPAYSFNQTWIVLALGGVALSVAIGIGFFGPQGKALTAELLADDPAAAARSRRIGQVSMLDTLILLVIVWAMVYKPGI
ncbi:MAG: hypothetical protein WEA29_03535 [Acidimicrobiia bacterium]